MDELKMLSGTRQSRREERAKAVLMMARLVSNGADDLCLIRDISRSGARLATRQPLSPNDAVTIDFGDNMSVAANVRWHSENSVGVEFATPLKLERLLSKDFQRDHRRRYPRFERCVATIVSSTIGRAGGELNNISPDGARIKLSRMLPWRTSDAVSIKVPGLDLIDCNVRWVSANTIGVHFDAPLLLRRFCAWLNEGIKRCGDCPKEFCDSPAFRKADQFLRPVPVTPILEQDM